MITTDNNLETGNNTTGNKGISQSWDSQYNMDGIKLNGFSAQAGWNTNKIFHMYTSLLNKGMPAQIAFDLTRQAYTETPNNLYAFGKKYSTDYNAWADHMMKTATKRNLLNVRNYQDFKVRNRSFNTNPRYWDNLYRGREADKAIFNKFNKQNGIDQIIAFNQPSDTSIKTFNNIGNDWFSSDTYNTKTYA